MIYIYTHIEEPQKIKPYLLEEFKETTRISQTQQYDRWTTNSNLESGS